MQSPGAISTRPGHVRESPSFGLLDGSSRTSCRDAGRTMGGEMGRHVLGRSPVPARLAGSMDNTRVKACNPSGGCADGEDLVRGSRPCSAAGQKRRFAPPHRAGKRCALWRPP